MGCMAVRIPSTIHLKTASRLIEAGLAAIPVRTFNRKMQSFGSRYFRAARHQRVRWDHRRPYVR
jgi:hypothetical protein